MRIAFISDIHGNTLALEAVLADIEAQGGVDATWFLGDFSSLGYDPVGVLERVTKVPNAKFLHGNHDRYTITGERPGPTVEQAQAKPELIPTVLEIAANMAWTQGQIRASGWWDWVVALPLELRMTLPDGTRILAVHAAPGTDDGPGIIPPLSDDEVRKLLAPAEADLVIVGHTHIPLDRQVDTMHVFNIGSVSNPIRSRLDASYAVLDAGETHHTIALRYVPYDSKAVIEKLREVKHPAVNFVTKLLRGEILPPWAQR